MRQILTSVIAIFWMAAFGLLAVTAAAGGDKGMADLFGVLGAPVVEAAGHQAVAGLYATLFALAASLFLWTFFTAFLGEHGAPGAAEEVARLAFGLAMIAFAFVLVGGIVEHAQGVFAVVAVILAALAASYLVVAAERWRSFMWTAPESDDVRAAARLMAAGAAHNSMLDRLSGRADGYLGGGRP